MFGETMKNRITISSPYTEWDMIVREIGGGIWFWMTTSLAIAFLAFIFRELFFEPRRGPVLSPEEIVLVRRKAYRASLWTAFMLLIVATGSAMRGFLIWMQFMYELNGWNSRPWIETWPWYGSSVIMNIFGAAGAIWLLSPDRWRLFFSTLAVFWSITIPVAAYFLLPRIIERINGV
jgi:hypothetical protein